MLDRAIEDQSVRGCTGKEESATLGGIKITRLFISGSVPKVFAHRKKVRSKASKRVKTAPCLVSVVE